MKTIEIKTICQINVPKYSYSFKLFTTANSMRNVYRSFGNFTKFPTQQAQYIHFWSAAYFLKVKYTCTKITCFKYELGFIVSVQLVIMHGTCYSPSPILNVPIFDQQHHQNFSPSPFYPHLTRHGERGLVKVQYLNRVKICEGLKIEPFSYIYSLLLGFQ